jgi:hypothetical protein
MANSMQRNRISLVISPEDLQTIHGSLQTARSTLEPHMVSLLPEERREMVKMGPRTSEFVTVTMEYMRAMPQYLPGFVDIDEFQRDLDAVQLLRSLLREVDAIRDMLSDSLKLSGGEAYGAGLACYAALKTAAKHGVPEAVVAANDLAERMPTRNSTKAAPPPAGAPVAPARPGAATTA